MKIRLVGAELFHVDGRTELTKITVGFRNFASMPKNEDLILLLLCSRILLRVIPNCTTRDAHKKESLNLKDPLHPSDFNLFPLILCLKLVII